MVGLAGEIGLGAMREMASIGQAHAQYGVVGLQQRLVHRSVGLGTGVRLHVGKVGAKQLLGACDRQHLNNIHVFAAAVITFARVTFGILVGQYATLCLKHAGRCVVLRGDQLDMLFLPALFATNGRHQLIIKSGNGLVPFEHGFLCTFFGRTGVRVGGCQTSECAVLYRTHQILACSGIQL